MTGQGSVADKRQGRAGWRAHGGGKRGDQQGCRWSGGGKQGALGATETGEARPRSEHLTLGTESVGKVSIPYCAESGSHAPRLPQGARRGFRPSCRTVVGERGDWGAPDRGPPREGPRGCGGVQRDRLGEQWSLSCVAREGNFGVSRRPSCRELRRSDGASEKVRGGTKSDKEQGASFWQGWQQQIRMAIRLSELRGHWTLVKCGHPPPPPGANI